MTFVAYRVCRSILCLPALSNTVTPRGPKPSRLLSHLNLLLAIFGLSALHVRIFISCFKEEGWKYNINVDLSLFVLLYNKTQGKNLNSMIKKYIFH